MSASCRPALKHAWCWLLSLALAGSCSAGSESDIGGDDDDFGSGSGSGSGSGGGGGGGDGGSMTADGCDTGANCVVNRVNGVEVSRHPVWFEAPFTRYVPGDDILLISYEGTGSWIEVNDVVGMPRSPGTIGCLGNPGHGVLFDAVSPSTARYVSTQCAGLPSALPSSDTLTALSITYEYASTNPIRLGGRAHVQVTGGPGLDQGKTLAWDFTFHVCANGTSIAACN